MRRAVPQLLGSIALAIVIIFALNTETAHAPQVVEIVQSPTASPTSTPPILEVKEELLVETPIKAAETPTEEVMVPEPQNTAASNMISRIQNPYSTAPKSTNALDAEARSALVNIHCISSGQVGSITGSGVVIDPRGIVLTNAHVAQYVLLASRSEIDLDCSIRSGSPARTLGKADVLHFPQAWVDEHAKDINVEHAKSSGEHDFALLLITGAGTQFPFLSPDTREAIAFTDDSVLLAGYPAEFGGGSSVHGDLYASSVFTRVGDLYTFSEPSVDLISLGGIVLAQGGSSGGAVVNLWGRLVGIISTTSDGGTTAERILRAITLAYVDRSLVEETGANLSVFLAPDPIAKATDFMANKAAALSQPLVDAIKAQ